MTREEIAEAQRLSREWIAAHPPDKQADAVITVIEQAERVCKDWSRAA